MSQSSSYTHDCGDSFRDTNCRQPIPNLAAAPLVSELFLIPRPLDCDLDHIEVDIRIDHRSPVDLRVVLEHDGKSIELWSHVGGVNGDGFDVTMSDTAATRIDQAPPDGCGTGQFDAERASCSGTYKPEPPFHLAKCITGNPGGKWTLKIYDENGPPSASGRLLGWGVTLKAPDGDGDGTGDCVDECPDDPEKGKPGECGCGKSEEDSDHDGTPDCVDECPEDPLKTEPGECGCGERDLDFDHDGTLNCDDECPWDPHKTEEGQCGCGHEELPDSDGDGVSDCVDECPEDDAKSEAGDCGCGKEDIDSDEDGTADCIDECPEDPNKSEPGLCGCGAAEDDADRDGDGFIDCLDNCPDTPNGCGCGNQADGDEDGVGDACDNCPGTPNADQADNDNDLIGNACDPTPNGIPSGGGGGGGSPGSPGRQLPPEDIFEIEGPVGPDGCFEGFMRTNEGQILARVRLCKAEAGTRVSAQIRENDNAPGPDGGTNVGFGDGEAHGRWLEVTTTAEYGEFVAELFMRYTRDELAALGFEPADLALHVLDESEDDAIWVLEGNDVGESDSTGDVGDFGYFIHPGGDVSYWAVRDSLSLFAAGRPFVEEDEPDDDAPSPPQDPEPDPDVDPEPDPDLDPDEDDAGQDPPADEPETGCGAGILGCAPVGMLPLLLTFTGLAMMRHRTRYP